MGKEIEAGIKGRLVSCARCNREIFLVGETKFPLDWSTITINSKLDQKEVAKLRIDLVYSFCPGCMKKISDALTATIMDNAPTETYMNSRVQVIDDEA